MRHVDAAIGLARRIVWKSPVRNRRIRMAQCNLLKANFNPSEEKLIIFLTPGVDIVNGGILSISSIYKETRNLRQLHQSQVLLCTVPGEPRLLRYTRFRNENDLFELSAVLRHFAGLKALMIHIPEYAIEPFLQNLSSRDYRTLRGIKNLRINVMLQNIKLLRNFGLFEPLRALGSVSCTTAHERYSSTEIRERIGSPLHKLSTYVSPEHYERRSYRDKRNLMIVSPDFNPRKSEILRQISRELPSLEVKTVQDMSYEEFKAFVANAKWALTFGEGLDNYFIETVFSGGISFAVYNAIFFTSDFRSLNTVYRDFDHLSKRICSDITNLNNEEEYLRYQDQEYQLCAKYYSYQDYLHNLELFYRGEFTFP